MDKKTPTVSVVIPTHNRAKLLKRAIKSVFRQTFRDFELIVVDDCSSDNTKKVVEEFGEKDSRVKYKRLKFNQGAQKARNTGIKLSKGKYIGLLDDDDKYRSKKLEWQVGKFKEGAKDLGIVYGGFRAVFTDPDRDNRDRMPTKKGDIFSSLLKRCLIGSPTVLIKKECFEKAGLFDEKLESCQDWDMWLRITRYYKVDYVDKIVADYYRHQKGQITTDFSSQVQGRVRIFRKYYDDLKKHPPVMVDDHLKTIVWKMAGNGQWWDSLCWHLKVMKYQPLSLRNYKLLLVLIFLFPLYKKKAQKV